MQIMLAARARVALATIIGLVIATNACAGGDWYVDFNTSDGGNGSPAAPFNTLADLTLAPGDTVNLTGVSRNPGAIFREISGVTFRQWPGRSRPLLRGDVVVEATWRTDASPGVFVADLGPSAPQVMHGLVEDWDHRIDEFGRNHGHLARASSIDACRLRRSSWFYDAATGLLFVHPHDGADPALTLRTYAWIREGNALEISDSANVTISGVDAALWSDATPGDGYAFYLAGVRDSVVEDSVITDSGYHSLGFVGSVNENNTIRGVRCRGIANSGIQVVYFAADEDIVGGRVVDCDLDAYPLLGFDGEPVSGRNGRAIFAHTYGAARIADLEFRNCRINGYPGSVGAIVSIAERTRAATDRMDAATYPVRFIECTVRNAAQILFEHGSMVHVAFDRCAIALGRADEVAAHSAQRFHLSAVGAVQTLYAATTIDIDASGIAGTDYVAKVHGGDIILNNATLRLDAPASVGFARFLGDAGRLAVTQSIIDRVTEGPLIRGLAGAPAEAVARTLEFDGAWISGVRDGWYHTHSAFNTADEWRDVVDTSPKAILGLSPGVLRPVVGRLVLDPNGSAANARAGANLAAPRFGVYGRAYDNRYGAEQSGAPRCRADANVDTVVDGVDLGMLLGAWGSADTAADLNADGVVDVADLGVLLGAWGPCAPEAEVHMPAQSENFIP